MFREISSLVRREPWRDSTTAGLLLVVLLAVYHLNHDFQYVRDAEGSVYLPVSVLNEGNLSFTPSEMPFMFRWQLRHPDGTAERVRPRPRDLADGGSLQPAYRSGELTLIDSNYNTFPSLRVDPVSGERQYINSFGIGAGLAALPFLGVVQLAAGDLREHPRLLWYAAKSIASLFVAASAALIYLTARRFLSPRLAVLLALAYGLGTGVWSTSSQTLWQHGPNEFFLALDSYFLFRADDDKRPRFIVCCALAFGAAVLCRPPTSASVAIAVGVYLLARDVRAGATYALAALPVALVAGSYGYFYLGSPFHAPEVQVAAWDAHRKTGLPDLWQTPLATGLIGVLVSPSRGLLVFSPFLVCALAGIWKAMREARYAVLRPLAAALVVIFVIESKIFDWWGGWSYGYRHVVDTSVLLALLLVPVVPWIARRPWRLTAFIVLLCWSVGVQFIGAFAYDVLGWNARLTGYSVRMPGRAETVVVEDLEQAQQAATEGATVGEVRLDIDRPQHRHRLWSVRDSQIGYYASHFFEARRAKLAAMAQVGESESAY